MSSALEGGFFTTGPPGKSLCVCLSVTREQAYSRMKNYKSLYDLLEEVERDLLTIPRLQR